MNEQTDQGGTELYSEHQSQVACSNWPLSIMEAHGVKSHEISPNLEKLS